MFTSVTALPCREFQCLDFSLFFLLLLILDQCECDWIFVCFRYFSDELRMFCCAVSYLFLSEFL